MRYQGDTRKVAALCPILVFFSTVIMPSFHCFGPPPPLYTNCDIEKSQLQGGINVKGDFEQLNGDLIRSDSILVR